MSRERVLTSADGDDGDGELARDNGDQPAIGGNRVLTPRQERANPPFNVRKLAALQQGSEKSLKLKEKFMAEIARHPAFRNNDIHDLTKDEVRERTAEKFASMVYFFTSESIEAFQERMALISIADPGKFAASLLPA